MDNRAESSSKSRSSHTRGRVNDDLCASLLQSLENLCNGLIEEAEKLENPKMKLAANVMTELVKIESEHLMMLSLHMNGLPFIGTWLPSSCQRAISMIGLLCAWFTSGV